MCGEDMPPGQRCLLKPLAKLAAAMHGGHTCCQNPTVMTDHAAAGGPSSRQQQRRLAAARELVHARCECQAALQLATSCALLQACALRPCRCPAKAARLLAHQQFEGSTK